MKKWIIGALSAGMTFALSGCTTTPDAFVKKIESPETGLRTEWQTNSYKYTLQYCPYDYLYIRETKGKGLTREGYENRKKELEGLSYFTLTVDDISGKNVFDRNAKDFDQIYNYYGSYFEYSVLFSCNDQEMGCGLYHVEGLYGIGSSITIHMGFDNVCNGNGDWNLSFVNELDSPDPIRLSFTKTDIDNRPEFKF